MSKTRAYVLITITTLMISAAQVLFKTASQRLPEILTNWQLLAGLGLYGIGALLMMSSFALADVSIVYPMLATSYIWVSIAAVFFFGEQLTILRIIGIAVLIAGVAMIGIAGRRK